MLLQILATLQRAGALEHQLDSELLPRQLRGIAILQRTQRTAVDDETVSVDRHRSRVATVHRVKTKQVGEVLDVS
jgi:hypothetical protein